MKYLVLANLFVLALLPSEIYSQKDVIPENIVPSKSVSRPPATTEFAPSNHTNPSNETGIETTPSKVPTEKIMTKTALATKVKTTAAPVKTTTKDTGTTVTTNKIVTTAKTTTTAKSIPCLTTTTTKKKPTTNAEKTSSSTKATEQTTKTTEKPTTTAEKTTITTEKATTSTKKPTTTTTSSTTTTTVTTTTTTTTVPPPSLNITGSSCLVKDDYIYLDFDIVVLQGDPNSISMCYAAPDEKHCSTFPICETQVFGDHVTIACKTFAEFTPDPYNVYIQNEGFEDVLAIENYRPLIENVKCKFRETDLLSVEQINATQTSVSVLANLTKPIYGKIETARLTLTGNGKNIFVDCSPDSETTAVCNATKLQKCLEYKACVDVETAFFGHSEKCIKVMTSKAEVPPPTKLFHVVLSEYIPFQSTAFLWEGPKLNTSADYYEYSYEKLYKRFVGKTNRTSILVECDLDSNFTVKLCTKCGCSKEIWTIADRGIHFGNWKIVASLKDQVDYWKKKNNDRMNIWTGIVGGVGGGFLIAIIAMVVIKRRRNGERSALLRGAQSVKYTNFSCNMDDPSTEIQ